MAEAVEQEVLNGRRAFLDAQSLLAGEPLTTIPTEVQAGWHDTSTHPETGSFAVVGNESGLEDWIGEILLVQANGRGCYVYVMGSADVPVSLSLARRAFCALAVLSVESIDALVQVIR